MSVEFKAFPDRWDMDTVLEHVIVHYRLANKDTLLFGFLYYILDNINSLNLSPNLD